MDNDIVTQVYTVRWCTKHVGVDIIFTDYQIATSSTAAKRQTRNRIASKSPFITPDSVIVVEVVPDDAQ